MQISLRPMQSAALLQLDAKNKGKGQDWTRIFDGQVALTITNNLRKDNPQALITWRQDDQDKPFALGAITCNSNVAEVADDLDQYFYAALTAFEAD